jgi:hypothetical protein
LKIFGQSAQATPQTGAGQVGHLSPGHQQKPGVIEHQIQGTAPLLGVPANPLIARGDLPGRGAKTDRSQQVAVHKLVIVKQEKNFA